MKRPFTSNEANKIMKEYRLLLLRLSELSQSNKLYESEIKEHVNNVIDRLVKETLRGIPVDELNRNKQGIKIRTLINNGYPTIADLVDVSVLSLSSIHGISEEAARKIKGLVDDLYRHTKSITTLKLSSDNKYYYASSLVTSITRFLHNKPLIEESKNLISDDNYSIISQSINDLTPAANIFKWFFTSKAKKQKAVDAYKNLVKYRNSEYCNQINEMTTKLERANEIQSNEAWKCFNENSIQYYNVIEEIIPQALGYTENTIYGLSEVLAQQVQEEPLYLEGLKCKLRRYQEWGVKYTLHQKRVLLGDEMGLGKTIQAIAAMVSLKNTGATHFMVVCPASVLANWYREINKHSNLSAIKIHGDTRLTCLKKWVEEGGVAVTTYETVSHFSFEDSFTFTLLVVDEAHYIKNPQALRTKNVKKLISRTTRLMFMTGTALENKVDEMISLIGMLNPNVAAEVRGLEALSFAPKFKKAVTSVYYRRKREDVLAELPELIENKEWCTLSPQEEEIYENSILQRKFIEARRLSWNVSNLSESIKAKRMIEIIEEAEKDNRKVIVFSFFLETLRKISDFLGDRCVGVINGSVSPQERQALIDKFDSSSAGKVLVAQIVSGGTGLNIQTASVVIICEPQFKPSTENQAISRAYRMGQTRNVLVHRLLCENTIDERITGILEDKQQIFDAFADESEAAKESIELDKKSYESILKDEIERINLKNSKPN